MELLEIEATRTIQLMQVRRPAGSLYLPEAVLKVAQRYSFLKPPTAHDLTEPRESIAFMVGKFNDTQINEFRVYQDGFIAEARSNSKILDAFIDDLFEWSAQEFGLEPLPHIPIERHHESSIIVRSNKDLMKILKPATPVAEEINKVIAKESFESRPFSPTGFLVGVDPTISGSRRKEGRFLIDRRVGTAFSENIY